MELTEIIATYQQKSYENLDDARDFILKEFKKENSALNRRYLPLFALDEDGYAYDPVKQEFYVVDPDVDSLHFCPEPQKFYLFKRKFQHQGPDTMNLLSQGRSSVIHNIQLIGSEEVLVAHKIEGEQILAATKDQYSRLISDIDNMMFRLLMQSLKDKKLFGE